MTKFISIFHKEIYKLPILQAWAQPGRKLPIVWDYPVTMLKIWHINKAHTLRVHQIDHLSMLTETQDQGEGHPLNTMKYKAC